MVLLSVYFINSGVSSASGIIMKLVFTGFILGIISHLVLDMLTPEGIWSIVLTSVAKVFKIKAPEKIHLVPKSKFFATGGSWEKFVRWAMWVISFILLARIIYEVLPYRINFL